jgi:tetratricopeptide (TPR) repeat protein
VPAGIRAVTRLLIDLDGEPGARDVADLAVLAVRHAPAGRETVDALAELLEVAGWILFEEERQVEAHRHNVAALALARAAGNRDLETLTLLTMSMQRAHVGRFGEALDLADVGAATTGSPRVRAMFALRRARAYSRMRLASPALRALDQSRAALEEDPSAPSWAWWIDEDELLAHRGAVLANLGRLSEAVPLLPDVPGPRFREVVRAMRFRTLVALGDWTGPPPVFTSPRARRTARRGCAPPVADLSTGC